MTNLNITPYQPELEDRTVEYISSSTGSGKTTYSIFKNDYMNLELQSTQPTEWMLFLSAYSQEHPALPYHLCLRRAKEEFDNQ